jgi:hypothetical protein
MKRDELAFVLNLANDMRREKNDELLEDLPVSEPSNSYNCILANAFNYGCSVMPYQGDRGFRGWENGGIQFNTREDAETYCKVVGILPETIVYTLAEVPQRVSGAFYEAPLTRELSDVAQDFDHGIYSEYNKNYISLSDE